MAFYLGSSSGHLLPREEAGRASRGFRCRLTAVSGRPHVSLLLVLSRRHGGNGGDAGRLDHVAPPAPVPSGALGPPRRGPLASEDGCPGRL